MTVLAIDTSAECASLVLLESDGRLTEAAIDSPDGHSYRLFGELQSLLRRANIRLEQIDCFAASAGPGSFTGVRVALSAVKGLATALNKPMAAVSTLQALAWFGETPLRAVVADARRGDSYAGLYNAALEPIRPEVVTRLEPWLASFVATAPGGVDLITANPAHLASHGDLGFKVRVIAPENLGRAVAHLAARQLVDPAVTDANYVRRADAEMNWVDR